MFLMLLCYILLLYIFSYVVSYTFQLNSHTSRTRTVSHRRIPRHEIRMKAMSPVDFRKNVCSNDGSVHVFLNSKREVEGSLFFLRWHVS